MNDKIKLPEIGADPIKSVEFYTDEDTNLPMRIFTMRSGKIIVELDWCHGYARGNAHALMRIINE